jgi:hypothetical protein
MVLDGISNVSEHAKLKTKFKKIGFLMIYPSLPPLVEPSVEKLSGYWFFQIRNSSDGIHY